MKRMKIKTNILCRMLAIAGALVVLWLAGLACNMPAALEATPMNSSTGDTPSSALTTMPLPTNTPVDPHHRIPGLEPEAVLVWWLSDGSFMLEKPGGELLSVPAQAVIEPEWGMPGSTSQFSFSGGSFVFPDLQRGYVMRTDIMGTTYQVDGPAPGKTLVGAGVSPNGEQLFWLYDVTQVAPNPFLEGEGCVEADGCIGRVYEGYVSDAFSRNPSLVLHYVETGEGYPQLVFLGWRNDRQAVLLQQTQVGVLDIYYPPPRGAVLEVGVPGGEVTVRSASGGGAGAFAGPEGNWLAWNNDADNKVLVSAASRAGAIYEVPWEAFPNTTAYQLIFTSDERHLYWLDVTSDETAYDGISAIAVRSLDLQNGNTAIVAEVPPPPVFYRDNLPFLTRWLTNRFLLVSTRHDTDILDVQSGQWVEFEWAPLMDTATLLGAIYPIQ